MTNGVGSLTAGHLSISFKWNVVRTRRRVTNNPPLPGTFSGWIIKLIQLTMTIIVIGIKVSKRYGAKILFKLSFQEKFGIVTLNAVILVGAVIWGIGSIRYCSSRPRSIKSFSKKWKFPLIDQEWFCSKWEEAKTSFTTQVWNYRWYFQNHIKIIELKIVIFVISFTSNKDTFKKTEQFHKTNLFPILDWKQVRFCCRFILV